MVWHVVQFCSISYDKFCSDKQSPSKSGEKGMSGTVVGSSGSGGASAGGKSFDLEYGPTRKAHPGDSSEN